MINIRGLVWDQEEEEEEEEEAEAEVAAKEEEERMIAGPRGPRTTPFAQYTFFFRLSQYILRQISGVD